MRVGLPSSAGSLLRRLLLLVVLVAALPASAHAQDPAGVLFEDPPTGVRPPVQETLRWTADGAERFECAVDDDPFTVCSSPWPVGPLGNGSHRFAVRGLVGTDVVAQGAHIWTVDAVKPVVGFLSGPSGPSPAGPADVTFEGGEDTVGFECSTDGVDFDTCSSPQEVTVVAGAAGQLQVRALDAVGNIGDPAVRSWTGIAAAPGTPVIAGAPTGTVRERTASPSFSAEGATAFACAVDSTTFIPCTSPRAMTGLADGPHFIEVRGVGADGTAGPVARAEWVVDGPPTVVLTRTPAPVEGTAAFSFTFTVDDGAASTRLECLVDGLPIAACTPGAANAATVAGSGEHTLVVRATDAGNNVGEDSHAWRVDLDGPELSIGDKPADPSGAGTADFTLAPSKDVSSILCRLTGPGRETAEPLACDASPSYEGLTSGRYTFTAQAFDAVGNAGLEVSHAWTVDLDAPVLSLPAAPPATSAAPTVELAWAASEPVSGFTCTLDGAAFEPCGPTVAVPNAPLALGPHTFTIRAVDAAGNPGTAQTGWTTAFEPAFDWDPAAAVIERPLTFTSRSAGDVRELAWDLDDDGFDDGDGPTATRTFAEPGTYVVRLRVTHRDGEVKALDRQVAVGRTPLIVDPPVTPGPDRRAPVAGFGVAPQPPVAGQPVTLTSTSSDPDGAIASWAWDLDGDGAFDDAAGPAASRSFPAGTHVVGLRVVDTDGLSATAFASVEVAPAPGAGGPAPAVPRKLSRLTPFPVVRIAGTAVGSRVRLRIFAIRAPRGTTVDVRCQGRGCPLKTFRERVAGKARVVRVRKLEARALRAGTVIEVRVLAAGRIGKYTRLVMRSGAAPKRTDACVSGMRTLKIACPA